MTSLSLAKALMEFRGSRNQVIHSGVRGPMQRDMQSMTDYSYCNTLSFHSYRPRRTVIQDESKSKSWSWLGEGAFCRRLIPPRSRFDGVSYFGIKSVPPVNTCSIC